jgi:dihydroneopterin aldolase
MRWRALPQLYINRSRKRYYCFSLQKISCKLPVKKYSRKFVKIYDMSFILVEGIKLYGFHGCIEEESRIGTDYVVDAKIEFDFSEAAKTDDLTKTVDYVAVYHIAKEQMAIRSKLIEPVARRIYDEIMKIYPSIISLEVKVTKFNPPVNGYVERVAVVVK